MNNKVVLGFLGGVVAASAVYFVQSRHPVPPNVEAVSAAAPGVTPTPDANPVTAEAAPAEPVPTLVAPKPIAKITQTPPKPVKPIATVAPPLAPPSEPQAPPAPVEVARVEPPPAPAPPPVNPPPQPPVVEPPPAPPEPRSVMIAAGTLLNVRLNDSLSTEQNHVGDFFSGSLDKPLVIDGLVIAEKGARVTGKIVDLVQAGRVKGLASMVLELDSVTTSDNQKVSIRTARFERKGPESKGEDAKKVGAGAALGAIIGAIAGGGKGAAIGAAAGGAAGGGVVAATRGEPAVLKPETLISFRIDQPVTITEKK